MLYIFFLCEYSADCTIATNVLSYLPDYWVHSIELKDSPSLRIR